MTVTLTDETIATTRSRPARLPPPITAKETTVGLADEGSRRRWRGIFGVGDEALREAVSRAGGDVFAVSRWLSQHAGHGWRDGRRGLRARNRRDQLVWAAMSEARRRGVGGLSFPSVAKRAGCSRSALVMYFNNKEGLGLAIIEGAERDFFDRVVLPTIAVEAGMARVRSIARAWVADTVFNNGSLLAALVFELDGVAGPLRQRLSLFVQRIARVFEALVDDAHVRGEVRASVSGAGVLFAVEGVVLALGVAGRGTEGIKARAHAQATLTWLWHDVGATDAPSTPSRAPSPPAAPSEPAPSPTPATAPPLVVTAAEAGLRHGDRVDLWLFTLRPDINVTLYVELFQHAMNTLHSQVLIMLGEATLQAVNERALLELTRRFPLLAGVRVMADGSLDCDLLRAGVDGEQLRRASRALFIEVLTLLSRLTGDVLLDALHEAVSLAESEPPTSSTA